MHHIHVVGLGVDPTGLAPAMSKRIETARVLVGGDRLLALYQDHPGVKIPIKSPIGHVIERIRRELTSHEVTVLADGDPGFYGIGRQLVDAFGRETVILYPNVTTLQWAAARLKIPWHDIPVVSLHGRREMQPLFSALVRNDRVAVFTDSMLNPARVADHLLQRGIDAFRMQVLADLGGPSERIRSFALEEAAKGVFSPLSFIILERTGKAEVPLCLGLNDDLYAHAKGLITKREIRAASLSALEIRPNHRVWDLGAGSGSVAIEASLLAYNGHVLAIEKDPERIQLLKENIRRTGAYGVEVIQGEAPGCLASLPDPDRIFMGGGMGKGNGVLEEAAHRLRPGGSIVLNLVLLGSMDRAMKYLQGLQWDISMIQIQVCRSITTAGDQRMEALNPVYILSARKPASGHLNPEE